MTRQRGNRLQNALAAYLRQWWPHAESAGAGRNGSDVLGTPGIVWECKTATNFKADFRPLEWVKQSRQHAEPTVIQGDEHRWTVLPTPVPVVVYFPAGLGEGRTAHALAIMPMHVLMHLLQEGKYTP